MVLPEEACHVDDEVADDWQTRQRAKHDPLWQFLQVSDAGQAVPAVDVHRIGAADPLAARPAVRQRIINSLETFQHIKEHPVARAWLDREMLGSWMRVHIGIVPVDVDFARISHDVSGLDEGMACGQDADASLFGEGRR
jgi:hypothetical protein